MSFIKGLQESISAFIAKSRGGVAEPLQKHEFSPQDICFFEDDFPHAPMIVIGGNNKVLSVLTFRCRGGDLKPAFDCMETVQAKDVVPYVVPFASVLYMQECAKMYDATGSTRFPTFDQFMHGSKTQDPVIFNEPVITVDTHTETDDSACTQETFNIKGHIPGNHYVDVIIAGVTVNLVEKVDAGTALDLFRKIASFYRFASLDYHSRLIVITTVDERLVLDIGTLQALRYGRRNG